MSWDVPQAQILRMRTKGGVKAVVSQSTRRQSKPLNIKTAFPNPSLGDGGARWRASRFAWLGIVTGHFSHPPRRHLALARSARSGSGCAGLFWRPGDGKYLIITMSSAAGLERGSDTLERLAFVNELTLAPTLDAGRAKMRKSMRRGNACLLAGRGRTGSGKQGSECLFRRIT